MTKVSVDTERLVRPLLSGLTVNGDVTSDLQLMKRALTSRPQLEKLAREADLDIAATTPVKMDQLVTNLGERIAIESDRQNIFTISYTDTDRQQALDITKILLNNFVEDTVGTGQEDSDHAEETLEAEIADYERRLTEAEERLKTFKQTNVGLMPDDQGDYYRRLTAALAKLEAGERELRLLRHRTSALRAQLEGEVPVFGIMSPTTTTTDESVGPHNTKILALESRLADLMVEYTDKHPEVIRTQNLIEELERQRDLALANRSAPINPTTGSLDLNPIYQDLRIQLNSAEVELAALSATVDERREDVEKLRKLVDVVPEVEAELNRLNRDYDVISRRYQEMLSRWEALQTSKRVAADSNSVQFVVMEPPFVPTNPDGPPRQLLAIAATVFSLGVGVGLAIIMHLVHPRVQTFDQLSRLVNIPVMGTISARKDDKQIRRERVEAGIFATACVFLFGGSLTVFVFAETGANMLQKLV